MGSNPSIVSWMDIFTLFAVNILVFVRKRPKKNGKRLAKAIKNLIRVYDCSVVNYSRKGFFKWFPTRILVVNISKRCLEVPTFSFGGAAIAQWIRLSYHPANQGSSPKLTIYVFSFIVLVLYLSREKNENKQNEARFGPFKKSFSFSWN